MAQSYEEIREGFRWDRPEKFNFAKDVIDRWADKDLNKLAMLWVDDAGTEKRISFAELSKVSCRVANVLSEAGVGRGESPRCENPARTAP